MIPNSFALRTSLKSFVLNSSVPRFIITLLLLQFPSFSTPLCVFSYGTGGVYQYSQISDRDLFFLSAWWIQSIPLFLLPLWSVGAAHVDVACMHTAQLCRSSTVLSYLLFIYPLSLIFFFYGYFSFELFFFFFLVNSCKKEWNQAGLI